MTPITTVMILAAGLGTRMRPITDTLPKPLVRVGGKALIDWTLDEFAASGVATAVVNVHHLAPLIRAHLDARTSPRIVVSDESERLLETGGGIVKALPLLGDRPFLAANTDAFTVGASLRAAERLLTSWDDSVDALLLLHPMEKTHGFDGAGDFSIDTHGFITPRGMQAAAPYAYAGIQLLRPSAFENEKPEPFSMWRIWTRLMTAGRLKGVVQDGDWYHVGTPEAVAATNKQLAARA